MEDFIGKFNGDQINAKLEKVKDMVGATASGAGAAGLVPAPAKGDEGKFLRGDGTWQDAGVHDPSFLTDNFNDENDFRSILLTLALNGESSVTQQQYDLIASKCKIDMQTQYLLSGMSSMYGLGDVILSKSSSGGIEAMLRTGSFFDITYVYQTIIINISNDLTVTSSISGCLMQIVSSSAKDIELHINSQDKETGIRFHMSGTGTKALMDDGSYQDIRGIDISSYLLEPDTITIVSSITKSKYDDIKSYILNNNHMYLSFSMSDSGTDVAFNSDIMASYIYDAAYLVFFDPNVQKMSKIKIDYNTYEVSTIVI